MPPRSCTGGAGRQRGESRRAGGGPAATDPDLLAQVLDGHLLADLNVEGPPGVPAVGVHRRPVLGVVVLRTDGRTERGRPGSGQLEDGRGRGGNGGRRRRGAPVRSSRAASGWGRPCTCCPARRNLTGVQRGGRPRRGRGGGGQRPRPARRSARPGPPRRTVGHARLVGDATVLVLLLLARLVQRLVLCGWGRGASGSASGPGALPLRRRRRLRGSPATFSPENWPPSAKMMGLYFSSSL